jgi:hypothetical protein
LYRRGNNEWSPVGFLENASPRSRQKKTAAFSAAVETLAFDRSAGAAGRPAGALHAAQDKPLSFVEIDIGVRQHAVGPLLDEYLESVQFESGVAPHGFLGYVHSQRRASAARDGEDAHPVSGRSLFFYNFLEFLDCIVRQTYHYFLLAVIPVKDKTANLFKK